MPKPDDPSIQKAITFYRDNRAVIARRLTEGPWQVGELTFGLAQALEKIDGFIELYEDGNLSEALAIAYIVRPCRFFWRGLEEVKSEYLDLAS